jgi:hypothetical protein
MAEWQIGPIPLCDLLWYYLDRRGYGNNGRWKGWGLLKPFRDIYADPAKREAVLEALRSCNGGGNVDAGTGDVSIEITAEQERCFENDERIWRDLLAEHGQELQPCGATKEQVEKFGSEFLRRRERRIAQSA